jgi:hypothetical protein
MTNWILFHYSLTMLHGEIKTTDQWIPEENTKDTEKRDLESIKNKRSVF